MNETERFDLVVIGAGQGGVPLATTLAGKGWKVALIERDHVGGTCVNTGCTPTKTLIASASVANLVRRAADYGVKTDSVAVDMRAIRQRKRDMVESFRQGTLDRIESSGATLIRGEARFVGPRTLAVRTGEGPSHSLSGDRIVVDTGARPNVPPIPGLDRISYLNSTTLMELGEVPRHLLIVGGGYVGVEFGQMFRRFGSEVTIVQRGKQLLTHEDWDVAEEVANILGEDGVDVMLNCEPTAVAQGDDDKIRLTVTSGTADEDRTLTGSHLLVAAGRVPNVEALDLVAAGIDVDDQGYILVNERLETSVESVYALGDVKGGPAFTHISYDDFRILRANMLDGREASIHDRLVPYTVFMDPQLGRVGLTERQAQDRGLDYLIAKLPMKSVARALEIGRTRGFMKALVDPETEQILGCAVLGAEGGEIAAMLQVAMMGKVPYSALRDAVFTHPAFSESLNSLFSTVDAP